MKHTETDYVTPGNGPRPNGPADRCFYCREPLWHDHLESCPCRRRTVKLEVTTEVVIDVPQCWDDDAIEFHCNESSSCTDNILKRLVRRYNLDKDVPIGNPCSCFSSSVEYIGEATEEDDQLWGLEDLGS